MWLPVAAIVLRLMVREQLERHQVLVDDATTDLANAPAQIAA